MRTLAAQPDLFGEIESAELRSAKLDADVHRQAVEFLTSPWSSLHQLRDAHPDELDELRRLSRGRGTPHSLGWRWYSMPSILNPWGCHHSYFESEREDDYYAGDTFDDVPRTGGFRDRIKAWGIVVDLARKLGPGVRP